MPVVTNALPLRNLATTGRHFRLRERYRYGRKRYGTIAIPPTVGSELSARRYSGAHRLLLEAIADGWLVEAGGAGGEPRCIPLAALA